MEDGELMMKEFFDDSYRCVLSTPTLVISMVKLNEVDISKYLFNHSKIAWYDVSKNSGRDITNADGTMVSNVINTKHRLDLVSRPLKEDEVAVFFETNIIGKTPSNEKEIMISNVLANLIINSGIKTFYSELFENEF